MARTAMGLTQEELADRAGVHVQTIRSIEYGHSADPRYSTVKALGKVLGNWEDAEPAPEGE